MATTTVLTLDHGVYNWMALVKEAFSGTAEYISSSEVVFTSVAGTKLHVFGASFADADLTGGEITSFTLYLDEDAETSGDSFATASGYALLVDTTPGLASAIAAHNGQAVFEFLLSQAIDPGQGSAENDFFTATGYGDVVDGGKGFDSIDYSPVDSKFSDGEHQGIRVTLGANGHVEVDHLDGFGDPGLYADDLIRIEEIIGTENADIFKANPAYDNDTFGTIKFVGGAGADAFLANGGTLLVGYDEEELLSHSSGAIGVTVDLNGGASKDTYGDADFFNIGAGAIFLVNGTSLNDNFVSGGVSGRFEGGAGDDTFTRGSTGAFAEIAFVGGDGADSFIGDLMHPDHAVRVDYRIEGFAAPANGVTANLSNAPAFTADAMTAVDCYGDIDTFQDIGSFVITGTSYTDVFVGGDSDGFFYGEAGSDQFWLGGAGLVTYVGGPGSDVMHGTSGHPERKVVLDYGDENGGGGIDINLAAGSGADTFGDDDQFFDLGTVRVIGTVKDDIIVGNDFDGEFRSGSGDDQLTGGAGDDKFRPGTAIDSDNVDGGGGFDIVEMVGQGIGRCLVSFGPLAGDGAAYLEDAGNLQIGLTTFANIEAFVGSEGNDAFTSSSAGAAAPDGSDLEWTGGGGIDAFNNGEGASILLNYDREKFYRGFDFGSQWGDAANELGVEVNLSNVHGFDSVADYGVEIDFDGSGPVKQALGAGQALDLFGEYDELFGILHVRGTDALDVLVANETGSELDGRDGNDFLFGRGGGGDTFIGGKGDDYVDGAGGTGDVIDYSREGGGNGVTVDLAPVDPNATDSFGTHDTLLNIENAIGTARRDFLFGDGNSNRLEGREQDDTLDGRAGADNMIGGAGADTYFVDDAGDVVDETGGNGFDNVHASISFSLADFSHVHGQVEALTLDGTADINAMGNGNGNFLAGNSGANQLDGLGGADVMQGGNGNDTYFVGQSGDVVDETGGGGLDLIVASVSFKLGDAAHAKGAIEKLTLVGSAKSGLGNGLANEIIGSSAKNTLDGGLGNDSLTGKAGADKFLFGTKLSAKANRDHVTDFKHGLDRMVLDDDIFRKVGNKITADELHLGSAAGDAEDRVIYDRPHGKLYYDSDGTGGHAKVLFAVLDNHAALSASDFIVTA